MFAKQLELKQRRKKWTLGVGLTMLSIPVLLILGLLSTQQGRDSVRTVVTVVPEIIRARDPEEFFQGHDRVNLVFIGRDVDYDRHNRLLNTQGRSDSLIIASIVRSEKSVKLISIPRDTLAYIPGGGTQKINAAHSLGGPEKVVETLRESLGIQVDYYVQLKFDGFKRAIDAFGGVYLEVPKDMKYHDHWGNLHIDLKKGPQWLNGAQAHGFARFRHDKLGDIGRIERQQALLKALAKQMLDPRSFLMNPTALAEKVTALRGCVVTNLGEAQMLALGNWMRGVNPEDLRGEMLPGRPQYAYWVLDREACIVLLTSIFGGSFDRSTFSARVVSTVSRAAIKAAEAEAEGDNALPVIVEPDEGSGAGPRLPLPAESAAEKTPEPAPPTPEKSDPPAKSNAPEKTERPKEGASQTEPRA